MSKKQKPTYTAEALLELKARLIAHRNNLALQIAGKISAFIESPNFDVAVEIRDDSQLLTTTCLCLDQLKMLTSLAKVSGEPQPVPYLDECGLEGG